MADDRAALPLEGGEAGDDGRVVAEVAVAVELDEVLEDALEVVAEVGPVRVTAELHLLPDREVLVDVAGQLLRSRLEALELFVDASVTTADGLHFTDAIF